MRLRQRVRRHPAQSHQRQHAVVRLYEGEANQQGAGVKVEDPRWGKVDSYHIETINWLKAVLDTESDRLADIRVK